VGLAVGPFVGYKYAARLGLTVEVQLGVEFAAIQAHASDSSTGQVVQSSTNTVLPLLNVNLGWSF
jgi:hypothetical protein